MNESLEQPHADQVVDSVTTDSTTPFERYAQRKSTLEVDARYRFLRSEPDNFNVEHCSDPASETWYLTYDDELDSAIDRALAGGKSDG